MWLAFVVGAAQCGEKCRDGRRAQQERVAVGSTRAERQGTEAQELAWGGRGFLMAWADEEP